MIQNKKEKTARRVSILVKDEESQAAVETVASSQEAGDKPLPSSDGIGPASTDVAEAEAQAGRDDVRTPDGKAEIQDIAELDETEPAVAIDDTGTISQLDDAVVTGSTSSTDEGTAFPHGERTAAGPELAELIATRAELRRVETERNDMLERLARRQADFENYRKRVERERSETFQRMVGDVVSKLLPVMDNMRRALEAESLLEKSESPEFRHFLRGVELIYKQLNDALSELGVEPVPAVGYPFDPHLHEAVATEHSDDYEPDTVTQELLRGYRLGEKLLRPAMVKVSTRQ
jgi:molecular chaperone GrpE